MIKLWISMSLTLLLLFGILFALLAFIGSYFNLSGYMLVLMAFLLVFFQWYTGPAIIRLTTRMRMLKKNEYPWLWEMVKRLSKKSNVPMPRLAIVETSSPNAFVFGRTSKDATLAITKGLIQTLNKDELEAVVAHEFGHIKHKDMIVMTIVGAIPILAYFIARSLLYTPTDERRGGNTLLFASIAFMVYVISNLLVLALSRLREYYSDYFSATVTRPSSLINALVKIVYGLAQRRMENVGIRSFYIADPLTAPSELSVVQRISSSEIERVVQREKKNVFMKLMEIFQTHPLTYKRIEALRKLEKGV